MTQCTLLTLLCTLTSDDRQDEAALTTGAVLKTSMHLPVRKKVKNKKTKKTLVQRNVCRFSDDSK